MSKQTDAEHKAIIEKALAAYFIFQDVVVSSATTTDNALKGQLPALRAALEEYDEPITEDVWNKVYKAWPAPTG